MSHVTADRVKETTLTTGTGSLTLAGAVVGYRAFSAVCANGDTAYYAVELGADWEVGLGTWATGNILARTSVLASSNANALVNFPAGTKNVFLTLPAAAIEAFGGAVSWGAIIGTLSDQTDLQSALDVKATPASVAAAVAALVDSSPGTLDTLNELAAALGDDANFATTVTNALAAKQPLDSDLTTIAAIAPANDDIIQRKAGAWINRTIAQLRTDVGVREKLTADRTYYVRTDGSDSNTGLTNTAGGAFLTPQGLWDYLSRSVDGGGYTISISIGSGSFVGINSVTRPPSTPLINIFSTSGVYSDVTLTSTYDLYNFGGFGTVLNFGSKHENTGDIFINNVTLNPVDDWDAVSAYGPMELKLGVQSTNGPSGDAYALGTVKILAAGNLYTAASAINNATVYVQGTLILDVPATATYLFMAANRSSIFVTLNSLQLARSFAVSVAVNLATHTSEVVNLFVALSGGSVTGPKYVMQTHSIVDEHGNPNPLGSTVGSATADCVYVPPSHNSDGYNIGTLSSGTFTPAPRHEFHGLQYATNNGAHTLAVPTVGGDYRINIMYTNGASAGAITTSGFTNVVGAFTTTNGHKFLVKIVKLNSITSLEILSMQGATFALAAGVRIKLAASTTFYLRTDGNDANDGLADTAGGAKLTLAALWDHIADTYDCNQKVVTISVGNGTFLGIHTGRGLLNVSAVNFTATSGVYSNTTLQTPGAERWTLGFPRFGPARIAINNITLDTLAYEWEAVGAEGKGVNIVFGSQFTSAGELGGSPGTVRITGTNIYAIVYAFEIRVDVYGTLRINTSTPMTHLWYLTNSELVLSNITLIAETSPTVIAVGGVNSLLSRITFNYSTITGTFTGPKGQIYAGWLYIYGGESAIPGDEALLIGADVVRGEGYGWLETDLGTLSSGTTTLNPTRGLVQSATNGGAHTLVAPDIVYGSYMMWVMYSNNASAGAITFSGFTKQTGDALTTTNGDKFLLRINVIDGLKYLHVEAKNTGSSSLTLGKVLALPMAMP